MTICNCTKKTLTLIGGIVAACAAVAGVVVLTLKFISKHKKCNEIYVESFDDDDDIITVEDEDSEKDETVDEPSENATEETDETVDTEDEAEAL